jgi:hypothetical protein
LYGEQAYIRVGLLQQSLEATIKLGGLDCEKLISLEHKYYLSIGHNGILTFRIMSQFKLENKTSLRFRYRLR